MQFESIQDLAGLAPGTPLGETAWREITQDEVNRFADVTGDHQWIHVDLERATREGPFGGTIVHGLFVQALIPQVLFELVQVAPDAVMGALNYGDDKTRFPNAVLVGSRVRGTAKFASAEPKSMGVLLAFDVNIEIEGKDKPGCSSRVLTLFIPK